MIAAELEKLLGPSLKTSTFTTLAVTNAIKMAGGPYSQPRSVSVTTASSTGSYNIVDPIVFTGKDINGNTITESLTLTNADGGETIVGVKPFASLTSIAVPAQVDVNGHFTFGVRDVFLQSGCRSIRPGSTGAIKLVYIDGTPDTLSSLIAGEHLDIEPLKIFGDSGTTVTSFIVFL